MIAIRKQIIHGLAIVIAGTFISQAKAELYTYGYHENNQIKVLKHYNLPKEERKIAKLIEQANEIPQQKSAEKVAFISEQFLDRPYLLGALGEGPRGKFDQSPPFRTDQFDCLTLVSTVVAMANSKSIDDFKYHIANIRYHGDAPYQYKNRNHFMSIDWNYWNQKKGYIMDLTGDITDQNGKSLVVQAITHIDKKNWYQHKRASNLKLFNQPKEATTRYLLEELRALSATVENKDSRIAFIPVKNFFTAEGKINHAILDQIPSGSIIEIVRPNWNLEKEIGTRLNVSHVGFAVRTDAGLQYRAASSIVGRVIDIPLDKYLTYALKEPTIQGINIQKIVVRSDEKD